MTYNNFRPFFDSIKDSDLSLYPTLSLFCQLVNTINVGCGCRRGAREQAAIEKYKKLPTELQDAEKIFLKQLNNCNEIEFHQDSFFCGKI